MNPCELCGKSVGASYFTSDHHGIWGHQGLTLHEGCARKLDAMTSREQWLAALAKAPKPKPKKAPPIPPMPEPTPKMRAIKAEMDRLHHLIMTTDDTWNAKLRHADLQQEYFKAFREQTKGIDPKIVRKWLNRGW